MYMGYLFSVLIRYTDNEVVLLRSPSCRDTKPLRVEYILA